MYVTEKAHPTFLTALKYSMWELLEYPDLEEAIATKNSHIYTPTRQPARNFELMQQPALPEKYSDDDMEEMLWELTPEFNSLVDHYHVYLTSFMLNQMGVSPDILSIMVLLPVVHT